MAGISGASGAVVDGIDHIRQSISDILLTPIGTCIATRLGLAYS